MRAKAQPQRCAAYHSSVARSILMALWRSQLLGKGSMATRQRGPIGSRCGAADPPLTWLAGTSRRSSRCRSTSVPHRPASEGSSHQIRTGQERNGRAAGCDAHLHDGGHVALHSLDQLHLGGSKAVQRGRHVHRLWAGGAAAWGRWRRWKMLGCRVEQVAGGGVQGLCAQMTVHGARTDALRGSRPAGYQRRAARQRLGATSGDPTGAHGSQSLSERNNRLWNTVAGRWWLAGPRN